MKKFCIAIIATSVLTLTGCQTMDDSFLNKINATQVEKESGDSVSQKIVKGKTTKDEISKMFGKPNSRSTDSDGSESWTYSDFNFNTRLASYLPIPFVGTIFGGRTMQGKHLHIFFDRFGVVESYSFSKDGY